MRSSRLHGDFLLKPVFVVLNSLIQAEFDHWIIKPQSDLGIEGMDDNLMIVRPCLIMMIPMLCHKSKGLDAAILVVVACQYQQPVVVDIGKPYLVLDQEPVRMMGNVEISPAFRWQWRLKTAGARGGVLNKCHPQEVIAGVGA